MRVRVRVRVRHLLGAARVRLVALGLELRLL